ncbi:MAG: hypothetical protein NTU74_17705 [Deltaproteobacteria bacterium]|nr:hypothetical protein [Deltaproteobacteria bacterium]
MKKNDSAKDNEGGRHLTRHAVLKAGLALGALASQPGVSLLTLHHRAAFLKTVRRREDR